MSNEEIARRLNTKVTLELMRMCPRPECSSKRPQWEYNLEQIKKKLAEKLSPETGAGLSIKIEI